MKFNTRVIILMGSLIGCLSLSLTANAHESTNANEKPHRNPTRSPENKCPFQWFGEFLERDSREEHRLSCIYSGRIRRERCIQDAGHPMRRYEELWCEKRESDEYHHFAIKSIRIEHEEKPHPTQNPSRPLPSTNTWSASTTPYDTLSNTQNCVPGPTMTSNISSEDAVRKANQAWFSLYRMSQVNGVIVCSRNTDPLPATPHYAPVTSSANPCPQYWGNRYLQYANKPGPQSECYYMSQISDGECEQTGGHKTYLGGMATRPICEKEEGGNFLRAQGTEWKDGDWSAVLPIHSRGYSAIK